jgi:chaperone required for assembly of F1-ATPase
MDFFVRDILSLSDPQNGEPQDPMVSAQASMRRSLPKRFYKKVETGERDGAWHVLLDGRAVKTPGRNALSFTSPDAAALVAAEFDSQVDELDPAAMPCYRLANTALDGVASDMQAVLEDVLRYCGTDMLFYRAEGPEGLVENQRKHWDPVVDWAEGLAGARFNLAEGIIHVAQPRETIAALGVHLKTVSDPLELAAIHSMTTLTGSALLALAVWKGEMSAADAWTAAHVDEDWNAAQWGEDAEAKDRRIRRWAEMPRLAAGEASGVAGEVVEGGFQGEDAAAEMAGARPPRPGRPGRSRPAGTGACRPMLRVEAARRVGERERGDARRGFSGTAELRLAPRAGEAEIHFVEGQHPGGLQPLDARGSFRAGLRARPRCRARR